MFVITINELLIGYDYFFIVKEKPFEVYLSDKFNIEQELYVLDYESINFENNTMEIVKIETQIKENVYFKKIGNLKK